MTWRPDPPLTRSRLLLPVTTDLLLDAAPLAPLIAKRLRIYLFWQQAEVGIREWRREIYGYLPPPFPRFDPTSLRPPRPWWRR